MPFFQQAPLLSAIKAPRQLLNEIQDVIGRVVKKCHRLEITITGFLNPFTTKTLLSIIHTVNYTFLIVLALIIYFKSNSIPYSTFFFLFLTFFQTIVLIL